MRNTIYCILLLLIIACNNDITSIGQNLVDDESKVEVQEFRITTATVKLDSFATSQDSLTIGRIVDPITGITTAVPYLIFEPSSLPSLAKRHVYDSITFHIRPTGLSWGDTTQIETFYIHQLTEIPKLDMYTDLKYNTQTTPYDTTLWGQISFYPYKERFPNLYSRLDDKIGREFFELIKSRSEHLISASNFIKYFNGLVIIPDDNNRCLLRLGPKSEDIFFRIHYHDAQNDYTYDFRHASLYNRFSYIYIHNDPTGTPYAGIQSQNESISFQKATNSSAPYGQTTAQGLGGYLTKMRLPIRPSVEKYKTIVKAEIELKCQNNVLPENFRALEKISVYSSDQYNNLRGVLSINSKAVEGILKTDPLNPEKDVYIINITDYYNILCNQSNATEINHILVGPSLSDILRSFNRMTIDEIPLLRVYYAKYE